MVVLCAELFKKRNGFREWAKALDGAVGHVHRRPTIPGDGLYIGTFAYQIFNHFVVSACGRVVECGIAVEITLINVCAEFLDEIAERRHPSLRCMTVRVAREAIPISYAGRGVNGVHADPGGHGLRRRVTCRVQTPTGLIKVAAGKGLRVRITSDRCTLSAWCTRR